MTTITLLAYAEGHPETGNANDPRVPLTLEITSTPANVAEYKAGVANSVGIAIRAAIQENSFGREYESVGWKSSSITVVGATTPLPPAPTGLQLTIQKTVSVRSVEHVDMSKHWTAFGAFVADWLDDADDAYLNNTFGFVLESYFRSIAGASITCLTVKA